MSAPTTPLTTSPAQMQLFDLADRSVLVLGLGESGLSMARWAACKGARVKVADTRSQPPGLQTLQRELPQAQFVVGAFDATLLESTDLVAWSPGLSIEIGESAAFHALCVQRAVPVAGEIELFAQAIAALRETGYAPKLIAITGTNGKTTTTRLAAHLCAAAGRSVVAAGNISPAALDSLREAIATSSLPQVWVLELSSFQLALLQNLRADVTGILNVTQDHLDWHVSMQSYVQAKQHIHAPGSIALFNRQDPATRPVRPGASISFGLDAPEQAGDFGIVTEGGLKWLAQAVAGEDESPGRRRKETPPALIKRLMPADALRIRGAHNHANALAALAACNAIGIPVGRMLHGLRSFEGQAHRCQLVAIVNDVEYYDDSKGTNVGATVAALTGLGKRSVLIAGGEGKGQDFSPLVEPVRRHAKAVVLIGRDAPVLREVLSASGVELIDCASMQEAVARAGSIAVLGDAVLLSPACASFDMFRNYGHRGDVFSAAVRAIAEQQGVPC